MDVEWPWRLGVGLELTKICVVPATFVMFSYFHFFLGILLCHFRTFLLNFIEW